MLFKLKLKCSFCGKSSAQVAKLVAGRRAYICDVCAAEAHRIMSDSDSTAVAAPTERRSSSIRMRIRRFGLPRALYGGAAHAAPAGVKVATE